MNAFFNYFFDFICAIFENLWAIIKGFFLGIVQLFNIPFYNKILNSYMADFGVGGWIMCVFAWMLLTVVLAALIFLLYRAIKRFVTFKQPIKENEELKDEITKLKHEMYKLCYERDKILAMQVTSLGLEVSDELLDVATTEEEETNEAE